MYLSRLRILNYKNIREADLAFSPKINCFVGNNGMGKTNLLDAVYYLSFCKSHCNAIDSQNITHDEEFMMLEGKYERGDRNVDIHCDLKRRQKKHFKCDKKEYEKLSDIQKELTDYVADRRAQFCTGTLDPRDDAQWQTYLDGLKGLRYDEWVEIAQTAYDRLPKD